MSRFCSTGILLVVATAIVAGCGGGGAGAPPADVYPVTGKITFKGEPLPGADVAFINADAGRTAFGRTNGNGEYQLTTFSANDGAVEGKAVVTISKTVVQPPTTPEADIESEAYVPPGIGQPATPQPQETAGIPVGYADQATSGLVAVVSKDGPNVVNFELTE